jgi:hypothetical protein
MSDGTLEYLEERPGEGGRLGRNIVWHDPRNRAWAARGSVFAEDAEIVDKTWWLRHTFDQGSESSCTMQAAAGVLHTSPLRLILARSNLLAYDSAEERYEGYRRAQNYDPWEGTYEGSSTDAPFKMLVVEGRIKEWRWCFGLRDVLLTLGYHGAVAVGTLWKAGMDQPRAGDALVQDTGAIRGGHAYELYATKQDARYEGGGYVDANQSWGPAWGPRRGRFRLSWASLDRLLQEDGEAVTVVR